MNYGTGAVMAVPAHDERDLAFSKYNLDSIQVLENDRLINSNEFVDLVSNCKRKNS